MRSGQYKISGTGSKGTTSNDGPTVGQFRSSQMDLPPADTSVPEFPHMNSLVVTMNKMSDSRPLNKSCENLSSPRNAVNRVELKVKSFLQRGESRLKQCENTTPLPPPLPPPQSIADDGWQYGHVVTLPRRPRLSLALSHSALNHLSTSDTASCLSASSGYSSSSSSSYGSFKSSASSNCSTLPRKKIDNVEENASSSTSRSCTFVDNPMYDITPGSNPHNKQNLTGSLKRHSISSRHDPIYDYTSGSDPQNHNTKAHRRRSASVPRHNSVFEVRSELDEHENFDSSNRTTRRGSAPNNDHLYDLPPDSDPRCYSRHDSPNLGNEPIYDTIPGGDSYSPYHRSSSQGQDPLYDIARPSRLLTPDSGTHGGLDSLEESALDSLDCSDHRTAISESDIVKEDQIAKECREFFEKRLKNSETLKKRWSMCSSDSGADSGDSEMSQLCSTSSSTSTSSPAVVTCASSTATVAVAGTTGSNFTSDLGSLSESLENSTSKKTPLDCKMEYLRKEIASLMKQDNQLFKQLLALHESISGLKSNPPQHPHRPSSPGSLDSFTEEEEDEEDDEDDGEDEVQGEDKGDVNIHDGKDVVSVIEKNTGIEENLSDVDEGLETDHSLTHSISPTSTLSSKSSRDSTLSSKSCRDSTKSSKSSQYSTAEVTSPESSPVQSTRPPPPPFQRAISSPSSNSQMTLDIHSGNLAFMRSRKSYAPNARNRRRSSSAHLLVRPDLETLSGHPQYLHQNYQNYEENPLGNEAELSSSGDVSTHDINTKRKNGTSQGTPSLRETGLAQRSLSVSSSARESLLGKFSSHDVTESSNSRTDRGGGQKSTQTSTSSKSPDQQQQKQHSTRPRSSSAVLTAAMYPSIPSSRPLNHPVFREALIM